MVDNDTLLMLLPVALVTVFVFFINFYKKLTRDAFLGVDDKKHNWNIIRNVSEFSRCTVCEVLLITTEGFVCDSCGICADNACLKKAANSYKCKEVSNESEGPMKHRWLKGNLPEGSLCDVCEDECLEDMRCIWCHRTVHSACLQCLGEVCDFGSVRRVVVPPVCVRLARGKTSRLGPRGPLKVRDISDPGIPGWAPLFVVGNPNSGSQFALEVLSGFRRLLNPIQTVSFDGQRSLDKLVSFLSCLPPTAPSIVLVAGGDGSVASVLSALALAELQERVRVAIVPLGTGNDLSRVLGWGKEESKPLRPRVIITKLLMAASLKLDRWCAVIPQGRQLGIRRTHRVLSMYNYLSVGVDARVTLDFHQARESPLYLGGRLLNKALYLLFGTQQVVDKDCTGLEKRLDLEIEGMHVDLPPLEAVVLLNIPSWGAGCSLWTLNQEEEDEIGCQSMSDGRLEVAGIYSSFHMAQLQVGLSSPYRIGQTSSVRIRLKSATPMQVDGEPWVQPPGLIEVTRGGQVTVLSSCPNSTHIPDE